MAKHYRVVVYDDTENLSDISDDYVKIGDALTYAREVEEEEGGGYSIVEEVIVNELYKVYSHHTVKTEKL